MIIDKVKSLLLILFLLAAAFYFAEIAEKKIKNSTEKTVSCNELNYKNSLELGREKIKKFTINLKITDEREWKENIIKDKIRSLTNSWNFFAFEKNNKRFDANLIFIISKKIKCSLNAKIRAHGDLGDHRRGSDLPSLNVHLEKGNIFGITKFILFRPHTRVYESEIFGSSLLRELNFLSPRTLMVDVIYNNKKKKFIFQEKIVKEFLENLNFIENPIYESDERFVFQEVANSNSFITDQYRKLQKSRLSNYKIIIKDPGKFKISSRGLSILNEMRHKYKSNLLPYWAIDYFSINGLLDNKKNHFKKTNIFDALIFSLNGTHALAADDRRFYFDPINESFLPLYYDGDFKIFDKNNFLFEEFNSQIIENLEISKVLPSSINGSIEAINLLDKIDINKFYNNLKNSGSNITKDKINKTLKIIRKRLENLKDVNNLHVAEISIKKNLDVLVDKNFKSDLKRKFLFDSDIDKKFILCDIFGENCRYVILNLKQISKALAQELSIEDYNIIYLAKKKTKSSDFGWQRKKNLEEEKLNLVKVNDSLNFGYYGEISYKINHKNKTIFFEKKSNEGRVIFNNSYLENWEIFFNDNSNRLNSNHKLKNFNGLTGCLTFIDNKINNLSLNINNSSCEDAVNIIRSDGTLKNVIIKNSLSDALDLDFSNININNIYIDTAINDCLDFSFGSYKLFKVNLVNCGDKGVSVGENSHLEILDLNIEKSNIGVASKDSSIFISNKTNITDSKICLSAYNKKQEFSGAFIDIKYLACKNYLKKLNKDKRSKIIINNQNINLKNEI